ncbi:MAG: hypothetical protein GY728_14490 [Phycisphaeraceae bacterium]|nr:hypothetical protein [Phycisphaeraceae bacterium]
MTIAGEGESLGRSIPYLVVTGLIAVFVIFRHRKNLVRIRAGSEPKVTESASS